MPNPFDTKNKGAGATAAKKAAPSTPPAARRTNGAALKGKPEAGDGFDSVDETGAHTPGKSGDPFSTPPGVSEYKITELVGALMLVKPTEVIEQMDTEIGQAENVVRADVTVLEEVELPEGAGVLEAGTTVEDVLVFQMALKRALLRVLDGSNPYLLGRLGMGNAKKGKNAPFIFERPDEDDMTLARQYLASVG